MRPFRWIENIVFKKSMKQLNVVMVVVQRKNTEMEITSELEERLWKLCLSYD